MTRGSEGPAALAKTEGVRKKVLCLLDPSWSWAERSDVERIYRQRQDVGPLSVQYRIRRKEQVSWMRNGGGGGGSASRVEKQAATKQDKGFGTIAHAPLPFRVSVCSGNSAIWKYSSGKRPGQNYATYSTVQTPQYRCHELTAAESTAWRVWKRLAAAIASIEPVLFCGSRAPTINLADYHAYFEVLSHGTERRERCAIPFLTVCWARKTLYLVIQQCQRHANTGMRLEPCQRSQTYNSHFPVRPPLLRSPFRRLGRV